MIFRETLNYTALIAGCSYILIFFAAIFGNFFVLEALLQAPLATIQNNSGMVRVGIMAFMVTVVFDVVVAWALFELYKTNTLSLLSTLFRMMHAVIMGAAIFALPATLTATSEAQVLQKVDTFNTMWLIGLFFFGIHLILLFKILDAPRIIRIFLLLAGTMYMVDTTAHFILANYEAYASLFLMLVAVPSVLGEMSLALWLIAKNKV